MNRVKELERENERVKNILARYNIYINDDIADKDNTKDISILFSEDKLTNSILNRYYSYFWCRKDIFVKFVENKDALKKGGVNCYENSNYYKKWDV